jgi:DNA polymerase-3 subunit delta
LKAATLLEELLAVDNFPVAICATLITQFRTWLWVKSTIQSGVKQDAEIAKICNIGNPKRVYFLKQEVRHTSVVALSQAVRLLLDLELSLKSGRRKEHMLPSVLAVAKLFE